MKMEDQTIAIPSRVRGFRSNLRATLTRFIKSIWGPFVALVAVAVLWLYLANDIPHPTEQTVEHFGVYGDSFGRVTSLFTALGFGGLVITLLLQQRQIRAQEEDARQNRQNDEKRRYEEVLFRLLDIYRQTLSEVRVGETTGRAVLKNALSRVDAALIEEGVNGLSRGIASRRDSGSLTTEDRRCIDYLHFRNFKIVATEIHPQTRLIDTFEVLLEQMLRGAPDHLLIDAYKELVFAQITFLECRYVFLVALSHPSRTRLRDLLARTGFFDRLSRSQVHQLHRDMYEEYWGQALVQRAAPASIPMSTGRIKRALRAHKAAGGVPTTTYTPLGVRNSQGSMREAKDRTR